MELVEVMRILKWLATSVLILTALLPFSPVKQDIAEASTVIIPEVTYNRDYYIGEEIIDLRSEYSKTVYLGNSRFGVTTYTAPIHYKFNYNDDSEVWKNIDTTIRDGRIDSAPYTLVIDYDKYQITFTNKKDGSTTTLALDKIGTTKTLSKTPIIDKNTATFTNVFTDVDIIIEANNKGVSIKRVIKSAGASTLADFNISQVGTGVTLSVSGKTGDVNEKLPIQSTIKDGVLSEWVDSKDLQDITYPLVIDPNLTVQPCTIDSFMRADSPTTNYGTLTYLYVQSYTTGGIHYNVRSLLQFNLSGIPADAIIDTSQMSLYYYSNAGAGYDPVGRTYWCYALTRHNWVEAQVTWNIYSTGNSWTTAGGDYTVTDGDSLAMPAGYGWVTWDIVNLTQDAYDASTTLDLLVKDGTEDNGTQKLALFYSSEYTDDTAKCPKLYVVYTVPPDPPTSVQATDGTSTANVTITWIKSDGATKYEVFRDHVGIGEVGDVDTDVDTGASAPVITAGTASSEDGGSTTHVTLSLAGESVDEVVHNYTVKAGNDAGWSAESTDNDNGYIGHGALTYQWYRSNADADAGYGAIGGATTDPYDDTAAPAPTVTAGNATASDGTSEIHVTLSVANDVGNNGAGRYYRCYLTATGATSQYSTTDRGYRGTAVLTYQWWRSSGDADADYSSLAGATTDPYNDTTAPADGSGRYYLCTVSMSGAVSGNTSSDRGYRDVAGAAPSVDSFMVEGNGRDWAVLRVYISNDQGDTIDTVGVEYGQTDAYGTGESVTGVALNTGDYYSITIRDLQPATVYHWRALASYPASDVGYGADAYLATEGSPSLREYLNSGQDGNSCNVTGITWYSQQFTTTALGHSVTSVRVYIKRYGNPGTVTLSLRHATAGLPTGLDLSSATYDGDSLLTSYQMIEFDVDDVDLTGSTQYAVVLRALAGDSSNGIYWGIDSGGGLASAISSNSTDGGLTWNTEAPKDALFEIWGEEVLEINGGGVFSGYLEDDDILFVADVLNEYPPYYPIDDSAVYFDARIYDTDGTTIIASTPLIDWSRRGIGVYLSADAATPLTWGSEYYIKIIGSFDPTNVISSYQLTTADWYGDDLTYLDRWVIREAHLMEIYYTATTGNTITFVTTRKGIEILNESGGVELDKGIVGLSYVRPDIFQTAVGLPVYNSTTWTDAFESTTTWDVEVGAGVAATMNSLGDIVGVDGKIVVQIGLLLLMVIVALVSRNFFFGLIISLPIALWGVSLHVFPVAVAMAVGSVLVFVIMYKWWFSHD